MFHSFVHWALAAILLAWPTAPSFAAGNEIHTDANLVTALDVSDSIMRHEEWLEFEGLAKAIVSADVLEAIAGGRHGRIGFAVFTWSSAGRFEVLMPWTLIASIGDAERVAADLRGFGIDRSSWQRPGNSSGGRGKKREARTDIAGAIDFGTQLPTPYVSPRTVINICGNGTDNDAEDPRAARDRALEAGMVVNGLVIGGGNGLADYFRTHVRGGAGSFVLEVAQPAALADAMIDKLLRDLIAIRHRATVAIPFT